MSAWLRAPVLAVLLSMLATGAAPGRAAPAGTTAETGAALRDLIAADLRVATIGYRLAVAATGLCPARSALSGLVIQDPSQYRAALRPAVAALFNLRDGPAVVAVVAGSPGDRTGLRAGDRLIAVNGVGVGPPAPAPVPDAATAGRFVALVQRLDDAFAAGPVRLAIERDGRLLVRTLTGTQGCRSDLQLDLGRRIDARADGRRVAISQGLVAYADDAGLAFVVAHEMAHNILAPRDQRDGTRARTLQGEEQADYLGLYLVATAGYDLDGVAAFWRRMRCDHGRRVLSDGTHLGAAKRLRFIDRAIAEIRDHQRDRQPLIPDFVRFMAAA